MLLVLVLLLRQLGRSNGPPAGHSDRDLPACGGLGLPPAGPTAAPAAAVGLGPSEAHWQTINITNL